MPSRRSHGLARQPDCSTASSRTTIHIGDAFGTGDLLYGATFGVTTGLLYAVSPDVE